MTHPLRQLIEDLRKATGPSRELNRRIHTAVHGDPGEMGYEWPNADAPNYSGSIDAALTLVPDIEAPLTPLKRWPATVDIRRHDDGSGTASIRACDMTPDEVDDELWVEASAPTPALALCIASLEARQSEDAE